MKILKNIFIVLFVFVSVLICQGCNIMSIGNGSVDNMLTPPEGSGDEAEIKRIINESTGGYLLKFPKRGNYRSAVILKDIDADGNEEAIAFYKLKTQIDTLIHMMIVDKDSQGVWYNAGEYKSSFTEVDKVDFGDVDNDGQLEMVSGFTNSTSTSGRLRVFKYNSGNFTEMSEALNYSDFEFEDFDADGMKELMIFLLNEENNGNYIKLLKYYQAIKAFDTIGQVQTDENVTVYTNVSYSAVFAGQVGVTVDETLSNGKTTTDIVYWDKQANTLKSAFSQNKELKEACTRESDIVSQDVNADTITDIPGEIFVLSQKNADGDTQSGNTSDKECPVTSWKNYVPESNSLFTVSDWIINSDEKYYMTIPRSWENNVVAKLDASARTMTISHKELNENRDAISGRAILKIKVFSKYIWDNSLENSSEFTEILSTDSLVYAVKIYDNTPEIYTTEEIVKNSFFLL